MSGATPSTTSGSKASFAAVERAFAALRSIAQALRATAFWSAAVDVVQYAGPILALVALHLCCLVAGHGYAPDPDA